MLVSLANITSLHILFHIIPHALPIKKKKLDTLLKVRKKPEGPPAALSWHSARIRGILFEDFDNTNLLLYNKLPT